MPHMSGESTKGAVLGECRSRRVFQSASTSTTEFEVCPPGRAILLWSYPEQLRYARTRGRSQAVLARPPAPPSGPLEA
jgi:hypothetical protein